MKKVMLFTILVLCALALLGYRYAGEMESWLSAWSAGSLDDPGKDERMRIKIKVHAACIRSDVIIDFVPDPPGDRKYIESLGNMIKIKLVDQLISNSTPEQEMTAGQFRDMVESASRRLIPGGKVTSVYLENFITL